MRPLMWAVAAVIFSVAFLDKIAVAVFGAALRVVLDIVWVIVVVRGQPRDGGRLKRRRWATLRCLSLVPTRWGRESLLTFRARPAPETGQKACAGISVLGGHQRPRRTDPGGVGGRGVHGRCRRCRCAIRYGGELIPRGVRGSAFVGGEWMARATW